MGLLSNILMNKNAIKEEYNRQKGKDLSSLPK